MPQEASNNPGGGPYTHPNTDIREPKIRTLICKRGSNCYLGGPYADSGGPKIDPGLS